MPSAAFDAELQQQQRREELTAPLLLSPQRVGDDGEDEPQNLPSSSSSPPGVCRSAMAVHGSPTHHHHHLYHHHGNGTAAAAATALLYHLVSIRCVSDAVLLPLACRAIIINGKMAAAVLLGAYLVLLGLWFPFWLLALLVTEWGVYALAVGTVFLIGRCIIRLLAFPGASRKVTTDIEAEFAKYSVRMIAAASHSLIDVATVFEPRDQSGTQRLDNRSAHQLPGLWRRVGSFRNRVLGVYLDVLRYLYQQESVQQLSLSQSESPPDEAVNLRSNKFGPDCTRFGNNRLSGDVGNFASLTVRALWVL